MLRTGFLLKMPVGMIMGLTVIIRPIMFNIFGNVPTDGDKDLVIKGPNKANFVKRVGVVGSPFRYKRSVRKLCYPRCTKSIDPNSAGESQLLSLIHI